MSNPKFKILVSHKPGLWAWFVMPPSLSLSNKHFGEEQTEKDALAAAERYVTAAGYKGG